MELGQYTKSLRSKIRTIAESYLKTEEPLSTTLRCCMSLQKNELSIICLNQENKGNKILFVDTLQFDDINSLSLLLKGISARHELSKTPVYWLLDPEDYDLNLIESMPVPKSELKTALNWRIRSLINYPIDEAVLEYFELPAKKSSSNSPIIAAVTAKKVTLKRIIDMMKASNLHLTVIDVPELALLNLVSLYENDEKSSAFIYFYKKNIILNISCQKTLYFTRRIPITMTPDNETDYEKLSLEILRYFDFFRSQWRLSSPTRLFIATESGDIQHIASTMTERLLNTVEPYTLKADDINAVTSKQIESHYLLNYGCLLRKDIGDATTTGN